MRPRDEIVLGGLIVGSFDLLFAVGFWALHGVPPIRIAQSIAAGVLGNEAYAGGHGSGLLGIALHYLIATAFVLAYWLAARRALRLVEQPWRFGLAYGAFLYITMNFVVLPLSAAGPPSFSNRAWMLGAIAAHLFIGVLCAMIARRASARRPVPSAR